MFSMITIAEAVDLVLRKTCPLPSELIGTGESLGRVLAEDITSDVDSPPHDKSLVDGFAVLTSDTQSAPSRLQVIESVFAGRTPSKELRRGQAVRIMTGAPIPQNADAVAMVEWTTSGSESSVGSETEFVEIDRALTPEANIQRRASVFGQGEAVIERGKRIRPIEIGLMAEVGCLNVPVCCQPRIAVLPTGDELVDPTALPGPGQIRNSNGFMLRSLGEQCGAVTRLLDVGRDKRDQLKQQIESGLEDDMLVLSGGVSMGQKDLVPELLEELGVQPVFHRVQLRPGKPVWFGVLGDDGDGTLVFGLPGNPLSSFVCFHLFAGPSLRKMQGEVPTPALPAAKLVSQVKVSGNRPAYLPAKIADLHPLSVEILPWNGSADQRTLSLADGMAFFPKPGSYDQGHTVEFMAI